MKHKITQPSRKQFPCRYLSTNTTCNFLSVQLKAMLNSTLPQTAVSEEYFTSCICCTCVLWDETLFVTLKNQTNSFHYARHHACFIPCALYISLQTAKVIFSFRNAIFTSDMHIDSTESSNNHSHYSTQIKMTYIQLQY